MALERKDVRFKLDAELHAQLKAICDLDDIDIGEYIESLVVPVVHKRVHDAMVLADRLHRVGITGRAARTSGKSGSGRE